MSSRPPRASGYFRTTYAQDQKLIETRFQWGVFVTVGVLLLGFPLVASPFMLDLATQVLLAAVGAFALAVVGQTAAVPTGEEADATDVEHARAPSATNRRADEPRACTAIGASGPLQPYGILHRVPRIAAAAAPIAYRIT